MLDSTFRAERAKTRQANKASHMEIATSIASQGTMCHTHKREKGTNMLTAPEIDYFIAILQRGERTTNTASRLLIHQQYSVLLMIGSPVMMGLEMFPRNYLIVSTS